MTITASTLFAGIEHRPGKRRCYYCGGECDETHLTKKYVKDTFTNRDIVKCPASPYVCQGCVMSLGDGWGDMPLIDGTVKTFTTGRSMAPRMYSWLLTADQRLAFTKAHIATVREILTDKDKLPDPPFALILSDSGQKQLVFRAPVAYSKDAFSVMLEDTEISITPETLKARLDLAGKISTALGKPVLREKPRFEAYNRAKKEGVFDDLRQWEEIMYEPMSKLAAWLAPPKLKG